MGVMGGAFTRGLIDIVNRKEDSSDGESWGGAIWATVIWIIFLLLIFGDGTNGPQIFGGILGIVVTLYMIPPP